ncbi:MAG: hypothetical protein AAGA21_24850 [Pseudomonadota bacterium]
MGSDSSKAPRGDFGSQFPEDQEEWKDAKRVFKDSFPPAFDPVQHIVGIPFEYRLTEADYQAKVDFLNGLLAHHPDDGRGDGWRQWRRRFEEQIQEMRTAKRRAADVAALTRLHRESYAASVAHAERRNFPPNEREDNDAIPMVHPSWAADIRDAEDRFSASRDADTDFRREDVLSIAVSYEGPATGQQRRFWKREGGAIAIPRRVYVTHDTVRLLIWRSEADGLKELGATFPGVRRGPGKIEIETSKHFHPKVTSKGVRLHDDLRGNGLRLTVEDDLLLVVTCSKKMELEDHTLNDIFPNAELLREVVRQERGAPP